MPAHHISQTYRTFGPLTTIVTACAASLRRLAANGARVLDLATLVAKAHGRR